MILALVCLIVTVDDPKWVDFTPKDGSFTARFPQAPQERATRAGTLWQFAVKDRLYNVAKTPLAGGNNPSPGEISAALDAVRDGITKRVQAKLVKESKLLYRNMPVREYLFELPEEKGHLRLRCLVVQGNVWEIKVGGPKDYVGGKEADTFLESLKIK